MVTEAIERIAEEFWRSAAAPEPFPRQLEEAVLWALPLAVFKLPRLWTGDVRDWLAQRSIPLALETGDRPLHGCLLAYNGRGCVLLNGADSAEEIRFSLAHETAHFLLDYLHPRRRAAARLGPGILEVFDGLRPATLQERAHALLGRVPIGFHTHLMDRRANGVMGCEAAAEAEDGADELALELLAPEGAARRRVGLARCNTRDRDPVELAIWVLQRDFGLPPAIAAGYARRLYPPARRSTAREWLRQRER